MINFLQRQQDWSSTAVIIAYDDSDGWYDHQLGQIVNQSQTSQDMLNGAGFCGHAAPALPGYNGDRSCPRSLRLRSTPPVADHLAVRSA